MVNNIVDFSEAHPRLFNPYTIHEGKNLLKPPATPGNVIGRGLM